MDDLATPRLARYLTYVSLWLLPEWSTGPKGSPERIAEGIAAAGFEGVQVYLAEQVDPLRAVGLDLHAVGRVNTPAEVATFVERWQDVGMTSVTLHLGTGFETPDEGRRLIEAMLAASASSSIEVLLETHRATLTQDPARTLGYLAEYPKVRMTADLAHWYTGVEMTYGGFDWKLEALQPVFDRVRLIHGRVSDTGTAQVTVTQDDDSLHVRHFRSMWGATCRGFLTDPERPLVLPFAPELLPPVANYARTVRTPAGEVREESDRWQQAILLCELAEELFDDARRSIP